MNRPLFALVALAGACAALPSQTRLHTFDGDAAGDHFGGAVAGAGDVDGDGIPDVIVGAPEDGTNGVLAGMARVFSGATGLELYTFRGAATNYRFGDSVAGAGDVNADGFADVIVGAIGDDSVGTGSARVFSGLDGTELHVFHGTQLLGLYGWHVDGAGDFDADGYDDVIVAGPALIGPGQGRVYSGRDGSILYQFVTQGFGELVAGAGDVDRDGFADVVIGSPLDAMGGPNAGRVRVISGRTQLVLHSFLGAPGDEFGVAVAGAGDVNGDGYADVIVGSRQLFNAGPGTATVFSGLDGTVLGTFSGTVGEGFGTSVGGGGDVDGDGLDDVIVGASTAAPNGIDSGRAIVYSVLSATALLTLDGDATGDELGAAVGIAGDIDDDGFADVVVGADHDDDGGLDAGRAIVEDGGFLGLPSRERIHGATCPGSAGVPRIDFVGRAHLGTTLDVRLRGALPMRPAVIVIGDPVALPLAGFGIAGCTNYADINGLTAFLFTDADGLCTFPFVLPPAPFFLLGLRLDLQWATVDLAANPGGMVVSNALAATFQ